MEINNLSITKHAVHRSQQRGIKKWIIEFVVNHADVFRKTREGAESYFISKKKLKSLIKQCYLLPSHADKISNLVVVECSGKILTVFRSTRTQYSI